MKRTAGSSEAHSAITANDVRDMMHKLGIKDRAGALAAIQEVIGKSLLPNECSQQELDKLYREFAQRQGK